MYFGGVHGLTVLHPGRFAATSLVQRIVEVHGGRVWVESEGSGRGSTFYLTLPGA